MPKNTDTPKNNVTKAYELASSNVHAISFEDNAYPVKNGIVWLTDAQAEPFLRSGTISLSVGKPLPEETPQQPGLELKAE